MDKENLKKSLEEFIRKTTLQVEKSEFIYDEDSNMFWFSIKTNEPKFFIGKTGETLTALNHLARRIIEKDLSEDKARANIAIDINDYQKKRIENLKTIAHMMAERARFFKSSIEVDPMSAFERRIIHEFLSPKPDVETESTGEGRNRRVVIKYVEPNQL